MRQKLIEENRKLKGKIVKGSLVGNFNNSLSVIDRLNGRKSVKI